MLAHWDLFVVSDQLLSLVGKGRSGNERCCVLLYAHHHPTLSFPSLWPSQPNLCGWLERRRVRGGMVAIHCWKSRLKVYRNGHDHNHYKRQSIDTFKIRILMTDEES